MAAVLQRQSESRSVSWNHIRYLQSQTMCSNGDITEVIYTLLKFFVTKKSCHTQISIILAVTAPNFLPKFLSYPDTPVTELDSCTHALYLWIIRLLYYLGIAWVAAYVVTIVAEIAAKHMMTTLAVKWCWLCYSKSVETDSSYGSWWVYLY